MKTKICICIDAENLKLLEKERKEKNRTVSNMIDTIISDYYKERK